MKPIFSKTFFLPLIFITIFAIDANAKNKEIMIKYSQLLDENHTITGQLYDIEGNNIADAKINVNNYALSTKSDVDGYFTLKLPQYAMNDERITLVIEKKGYKPKTIFFYTPIAVNNTRLIESDSESSITIEQIEADQSLIRGIVTGTTDGISGMSVTVSNEKIGTVTDMEGEFQLNLPDAIMNQKQITLNLSSVGYKPLSVKINTSEIPLMMRVKLFEKAELKTVSPSDRKKKFNDDIY